MAKFFPVEGAVREVKPANGVSFTYEELRAFIGGIIQIVPMPSGLEMVVHDEGKLIGLPVNVEASKYWLKEYPMDQYPHNNHGTVAGPALVATYKELNGEE